jgi:hypothetical protein
MPPRKKQPKKPAQKKKVIKRRLSEEEVTQKRWRMFAENERIVKELENANDITKVRALFGSNPAYRRLLNMFPPGVNNDHVLMTLRNELLERARSSSQRLGKDLYSH